MTSNDDAWPWGIAGANVPKGPLMYPRPSAFDCSSATSNSLCSNSGQGTHLDTSRLRQSSAALLLESFQFPDSTGASPPQPGWRKAMELSFLRLRTRVRGLAKVVGQRPCTALLPAMVYIILLVAGELAVWGVANSFAHDRYVLTATTAATTVQQVELLLQSWIAPTISLGSAAKQMPHVPHLVQELPTIMQPIIAKTDPTKSSLRLSLFPWLINSGSYPVSNQTNKLIGVNLIDSSLYQNSFRQFTGSAQDYSDVWGPVVLLDRSVGFVTRFNIWLPSSNPNETWGMDQPITAPWAPGIIMGNASRTKLLSACGKGCANRPLPDGRQLVFWGVVSNTVSDRQLTQLLAHLGDPDEQSVPFRYALLRKIDAHLNDPAARLDAMTVDAGNHIIYRSPGPHKLDRQSSHTVCRDLGETLAVNITWTLCIAPVSGYQPLWAVPLHIMVPFLALIIAGLVFLLMASQEMHRVLVEAILPAKVIKELGAGNVYMEDFKSVTTLFSDIVSYTNISSELTPCELVKILDELYSGFDRLVDKHGLHKVETIGDAFFCVGGAPTPCKPLDAARRVALMALDMVDFVERLQVYGKHKIRIRVGIYTGDVTAAVMGSKVPHWALVGDTINVTSRMESNSRPQSINVGPTTAALLSSCPEFELEPRGEIDIKGKGRMHCYWLHAASASQAHDCMQGQCVSIGMSP